MTEGIDALGEVSVRVQPKSGQLAPNAQGTSEVPRTVGGHGADTDIMVASVKAYVAALNKLLVILEAQSEPTQPPETRQAQVSANP